MLFDLGVNGEDVGLVHIRIIEKPVVTQVTVRRLRQLRHFNNK